ncbi:small glutamine-rich tetratricopeptide repeat-containing protein beta-like isoform X2 [Glandiceps talaboti]
MSGTDVNRLVFSFIQFLESQLQSGHLSPDAAESVEVAIQCLETAYGIDTSNDALASQLRTGAPLLEIFNSAAQATQETGAGAGAGGLQPTVTITTEHLPEKKKVTEEEKCQAELLKVEGNNFMKSEHYRQALECYTQAISLDNCNAVYYCNRAAAYSKLDQHQQAIEDCKKALEIDPKYSKAYGRMGLAFTSLNEHEKARDAYKQATDLDPDNASYLTNLKIAEQKLRETNLGAGGLGGGFGPFGGGGGGGMPDIGALLNNPALMSMASSMMQNPQMQNLMQGMLSGAMQPGAAPPTGAAPEAGGAETATMANLLQAGQQLAQQVQQTNPELVDHLRQQMSSPENRPNPNNNEGSEGN